MDQVLVSRLYHSPAAVVFIEAPQNTLLRTRVPVRNRSPFLVSVGARRVLLKNAGAAICIDRSIRT